MAETSEVLCGDADLHDFRTLLPISLWQLVMGEKMGPQENLWESNEKQVSIMNAQRELSAQVLSLDLDGARISGSLTPNHEKNAVELRAEVHQGSGKDPSHYLSGDFTEDGGKMRIFDAGHKLLEEVNCDKLQCKRTDASGTLLAESSFGKFGKETRLDLQSKTGIGFGEFSSAIEDWSIKSRRNAKIANESGEIGSISETQTQPLANIMALFGRARTSSDMLTVNLRDGEERVTKSLQLDYTELHPDKVEFSGHLETRKETRR